MFLLQTYMFDYMFIIPPLNMYSFLSLPTAEDVMRFLGGGYLSGSNVVPLSSVMMLWGKCTSAACLSSCVDVD